MSDNTVYTELTRRIAELEAQLAQALARARKAELAESVLNNEFARLELQNEELRLENARLRNGRRG
jgi:hypothetical protein